MSAFSEREPQPVTATSARGPGSERVLGSAAPSRSENAAPPAAVVRAGLEAPTQWAGYLPVRDPDARRDAR